MPEFKSQEEYEKWKAEKMKASNRTEQKPAAQSGTEEKQEEAEPAGNFCPGCGNKLIQPDRFCPRCGRALDNEAGRAGHGSPGAKPEPLPGDEDFAAFVGNNSPKYLEKFRKFSIGGVDNFVATWHWPAFLAGFWWMLYRKLYLWALGYFIVMFVPYVNFVAWIAAGIVANYIYYKEAKKKILALRAQNAQGDISVTLAQVGGVNKWVPAVAVIVTLLALILAIVAGLMSSLIVQRRYI